jgi:hypothetical protein
MVYLVCADKPAAPDAPVADSTSRRSITVAWNEPSSTWQAPVSGYNVYLNDLSVGEWVLVYHGEGYPSRHIYTVENLTPGQSYRVKVGAQNAVGEGANSTEALFTASDYPAAPGQPVLLSSMASGVSFAWQPPSDNGGQSVVAYEVHHKLANQGESAWRLIATIAGTDVLQYTHTGLSADVDV